MSEAADATREKPANTPGRGRPTGATRKGLETRVRIIKGAREALEEGGMEALVSYMRKLPRAHPPGEVWNYNTGETNLIGGLVSEATGKPVSD